MIKDYAGASGGSVPEAWAELPPESDFFGVFGAWRSPEPGFGARLARAATTLRNFARLGPPAARMARATAGSMGRRFTYDFGFVPAMPRLLMSHRDFGLPFLMSYARIMFGPGVLTRAEREAVAAVSSAAQDCFY